MTPLRRAVLIVALLNLGYFGIELVVALSIGSVALFADSVDFLEDTLVNLLVLAALPWAAARRRRVGSVLAFLILIPAFLTIVTAITKILEPVPPAPEPLTATAAGALLVNLACALIIVRHRAHPGGLMRAAWLSARNDVLADAAIVAIGIAGFWITTGWLDIALGLAIGLLNADAARAVWRAARREVDVAEGAEA